MKSSKNIQPKFDTEWLSEKIIYFKYKDNVVVELDDVKKMLELQNELGVNESIKRIVHAGKYTTLTTEAREHIEKYKPRVKAEAFVLSNLAQKILFNFYFQVRKNDNPLKSFRNLNSAINWIERF